MSTTERPEGAADGDGSEAGPRIDAPRPNMAVRGMAGPGERSRDFGATVRRVFSRLRQEKVHVAGVVVLAVVAVSMQVVGPRILGHATDLIFTGVQTGSWDFAAIHRTLLFAAGLYLTASVLTYYQAWLLAGIVQGAMSRLRSEVEHKLNHLPLSYVDRQARGDLLSRVTNDIDNMAQSLQQTLTNMLTALLSIVGVVIMMFTISPLLACIATIIIPVTVFVTRYFARVSRKRFGAQWHHTGELNAMVEESITGHAIVKAFGQQHAVEERFRETNELLYDASARAQFSSGALQPVTLFVGNLNFIIVAVFGGIRVANGQMSIGDVQAFIQYSRQMQMPMGQLASMFNVFQSGLASAERVFDLLDGKEEVPDDYADVVGGAVRGRVAFEDVSFSYSPDRELIRDLSLVAEPGQTVAIVGPTGAGKTTLVNLLMRFYDVDGGRITVDGHDIREMKRAELRSMMGMVLQDTWLFGGTIRENIAYGNPEASEEQLLEAAKATYVDRFVRSLPEGYDTILDEEHGTVSAGEMQLLTIARAFLAAPAILILDEATSSVDTRTEVLIQEAMNALRQNRTSFVIAHRLSTIRDADIILVMEDGRIVEQGDHDALLEADGAYARLYNAQFAAAATEIA